MVGAGTLGDTYVDELLAEYTPPRQDLLNDVLSEETDELLYAILLEQRVRRMQQTGPSDIRALLEQQRQAVDSGSPDVQGTYVSLEKDINALQNADDWVEVDLDFVAGEVDLRFDVAVNVAYQEPTEYEYIVKYDSGESPVVGVPIQTSEVWLSAQSGTGGGTCTVDAWQTQR